MAQSLSQMKAAAQASGNAFLSANPAAADHNNNNNNRNSSSEGAALAVLTLPPNLSRIEGHRVLASLQKAIERLKLLTLLDAEQLSKTAAAAAGATTTTTGTNNNANDHGMTNTNSAGEFLNADGTTASGAANQNSGIAQILQEQARLEQRYDSLVAASKARQGKNPNEPVLDPQCFAHVPDQNEQKRQQELQEVASSLKSHSKMLCRLLKDNPCDADNWRKIIMERSDLIAALDACAVELAQTCQPPGTGGANNNNNNSSGGLPGSFQKFATKVLEDQAASVWADGLVRKERETNQNVKQLQNDVKAERSLKEQEIEQRQKMISELKGQLTSLRNTVRAQLDQLRSQTEASSEAQQREALNRQRELKEKIALLRVHIKDEQAISGSFKAHTAAKCVSADRFTEEWSEKYVAVQREMNAEKADREKTAQKESDRLQTTRERCDNEVLNARARAKEKEDLEEEKQEREASALARYAAATKVQAAIKAFFTRQVLVGLKKKALKKNRKAAAAAAAAAKAPPPKNGKK